MLQAPGHNKISVANVTLFHSSIVYVGLLVPLGKPQDVIQRHHPDGGVGYASGAFSAINVYTTQGPSHQFRDHSESRHTLRVKAYCLC